ncbi:fimbrial protein [Yersinia aldovae]|uniref:fimbrial protein n=1 Tax=Yersinia aldovae TaxID=29483 RepID=UPI0021BDA58B|nr:fimbrial protein [Yersinia aldovae]
MFTFKLMENENKPTMNKLMLLCILLFIPTVTNAAVKSTSCIFNGNNKVDVKSIRINNGGMQNKEQEIGRNTKYVGCNIMVSKYINGNDRELVVKINANKPSIPGRPNTYTTNLNGVGIKVNFDLKQNKTACSDGHETPTDNGVEYRCKIPTGGLMTKKGNQNEWEAINFTTTLVILDSKFSTGLISDLPTFNYTYYMETQGQGTAQTIPNIEVISTGLSLLANSCTLDTPDINFNLGKQQQVNFTGIGPKGNGLTEKIKLTCDPDTKYSFHVTSPSKYPNKGVIELDSGSSATGVGVQLIANGKPVEIGNPMEVGTSKKGNSQETIDITARYYQTENKVTPGTANATATFTMTYQ